MSILRGLSLFSGIGGLDLAFEWAGGVVSAMCELEPYCRKVLRHHWPHVPLFEDIRELKGSDVGAVDVIYGGFPCQPFSVAGNKRGKDDTRYLWPEFLRLVSEIRPRWVVAENVPGILRLAADDVCGDLERQSYSVGIWDFEAAAVGARHRRERIFFVAHTDSPRLQGSEQPGELRTETERRLAPQLERANGKPPGCSYVSDTNKIRCDLRRPEGQGMERQKSALNQADTGREVVTDTSSSRCERVQSGRLQETHAIIGGCGRWEPEPGVDRVVNGLTHRVDRLRALGNAVVPQQAFPVFRAIIEADEQV